MVRWHAIRALAEIGDERAIEPLLQVLEHPEEQMRRTATQALEKFKEAAAPQRERLFGVLVALLSHPDQHTRHPAAQALGAFVDVRAVEPLLRALDDPYEHVRLAAINSLRRHQGKGAERAIEAVIARLKDPYQYTRKAAVEFLGALREEAGARAVAPLIAVLEDAGEDSWVRSEAAKVLGQLGDLRALSPLLSVLNDKTRQSAVGEALRGVAASALGGLAGGSQGEAIPHLLKALGDKSNQVHYAAKPSLVAHGERAVSPLLAALKDKNKELRQRAISVLVELAEVARETAVLPLLGCLSDPDPRMRSDAASLLGSLGDKRAVEPLIAALKDASAEARHGAASGLSRLGDPRAVEPLIAALKDEDALVRYAAIFALGKLGDPRALPELEYIRENDSSKSPYPEKTFKALATETIECIKAGSPRKEA